MKVCGVESRSSWGRMLVSDAFSAGLMAAAVNSLKYSFRVMRPDGSTRNSFPSGHTATAFMTATMLHKEYGHRSPWYSIGGYTLATLTGVTRQLNNRHWMSDVMVGAGIGILATEFGYFLADLIFKEKGLKVRETYVVFEHQPYDLLAALQIVGSVRENHVELFRTTFEVEEDVGFDCIEVPDAQLRRRLADEVVVYRIDFHRGYAPRSARCELIADRAGSREEVQHVALLEIQQIAEDVEEVLLGEIGRRPRPQVAGRVDGPALVFSAYYSHTICLKYPPSFRFNARPSPLPMRSV